MKSLLAALALALATPVLLVPVEAHAEMPSDDVIKASLDAEATALKALVDAVRADVKSGKLKMSDEAREAWEKGLEAWKALRAKAKEGDFVGAYTATREARAITTKAAEESFEGKASDAVGKAMKGYVDAVKPRVAAVHDALKDGGAEKLLEEFEGAKAMYAEAEAAAGEKKWGKAWKKVQGAMDTVDGLMAKVIRHHNKGEAKADDAAE